MAKIMVINWTWNINSPLHLSITGHDQYKCILCDFKAVDHENLNTLINSVLAENNEVLLLLHITNGIRKSESTKPKYKIEEFGGGSGAVYKGEGKGIINPFRKSNTSLSDEFPGDKLAVDKFIYVWNYYWNNFQIAKRRINNLFIPLCVDLQGVLNVDNTKVKYFDSICNQMGENRVQYFSSILDKWNMLKNEYSWLKAINENCDIQGFLGELIKLDINRQSSPEFIRKFNKNTLDEWLNELNDKIDLMDKNGNTLLLSP